MNTLSQHGSLGHRRGLALRYFWSTKEPKQVGADPRTHRSVTTAKHWDIRSAGLRRLFARAPGAIPLAWPYINPRGAKQSQNHRASGARAHGRPAGYCFGLARAFLNTEIDVRPHLAGLPKGKVMCFFGTAEKNDGDTACTVPRSKSSDRFGRPEGTTSTAIIRRSRA